MNSAKNRRRKIVLEFISREKVRINIAKSFEVMGLDNKQIRLWRKTSYLKYLQKLCSLTRKFYWNINKKDEWCNDSIDSSIGESEEVDDKKEKLNIKSLHEEMWEKSKHDKHLRHTIDAPFKA